MPHCTGHERHIGVNRSQDLPVCPVCCDTLGTLGGPVTLPCGHNGCLHCLQSVHRLKAECPLCRGAFDGSHLVVNTELRSLMQMAAAIHGGSVGDDGWEALPSAKWTVKKYTQEVFQHTNNEEEHDELVVHPSAPPANAIEQLGSMQQSMFAGDVLAMEPPQWLPDSYASSCGICHQVFRAAWRSRHHCRLCGRIFCHTCCHRRMILPPKFRQRLPQRVCQMCVTVLEPLQPLLASQLSSASQPPVHDVTDWTCMRSWVNNPLSSSLNDDIYKATNILRSCLKETMTNSERRVSQSLLQNAAGFAILSVLRFGVGWTCAVGSGVLVARRGSSWTPPSAIGCYSCGWGPQVGGELTDMLIVLSTQESLKAFCGNAQVGLGGHISAALGPTGRQAEAAMRVGDKGAAVCYSYSISRGMFIGMGLEGSFFYTRLAANHDFYGQQLTSQNLLLENSVAAPHAAYGMYESLDQVLTRFACSGSACAADNAASVTVTALPPCKVVDDME